MIPIKFKFNRDQFLSVAKRIAIIGSIILNILALGYLYRELTLMRQQQVATPTSTSPTPIANSDELKTSVETMQKDLAGLTTQFSKLQSNASLIGQTLDSCSIVAEAYSWFGAKPEYNDKLNSCANSYKKLQKSL